MKCVWIISIGLAGQLAFAEATGGKIPLPPVLRNTDPQDNVVIKLPGSAPVTPPRAQKTPRVKPAAQKPSVASKIVPPNWHPIGVPALPPTPDVDSPAPPAPPHFLAKLFVPTPAIKPEAKPVVPSELTRESAMYCQKRIGQWKLADAKALLGEPARQRAAVDDDQVENGRIYAFHDPTGRYRELELDFDKARGVLRTVFVYPWNLSWQDCRQIWGDRVNATQANKGRMFYSYLNRRLDVLVDTGGKVISLGLY